MMGVFVQVNGESKWGSSKAHPVGYIIQESGCWDWVGARKPTGHGVYRKNGKTAPAQRVIYESLKGPIPDGLHLDHLCRRPICVNPDHLEPVTLAENVLRGDGVTAKNKRKVLCPKGHLLGPPTGPIPRRRCVECKRNDDRKYKAKKREARLAALEEIE